jgi:hypothetical protein
MWRHNCRPACCYIRCITLPMVSYTVHYKWIVKNYASMTIQYIWNIISERPAWVFGKVWLPSAWRPVGLHDEIYKVMHNLAWQICMTLPVTSCQAVEPQQAQSRVQPRHMDSGPDTRIVCKIYDLIKGIVSWDWKGLLMVLLDRYEVPLRSQNIYF